jgi:hypothetical protein
MSAIDDLKASDTLKFSGLSYHLSAPIIGDSDSTTMPLCVPRGPKELGKLAFTLTSANLSLPVPDLTLLFAGTAKGNQVTWTINQGLDVFTKQGLHISGVHGQIVTIHDEVPASLGTDCSGAQRVQKATFATIGGANTLTIDTSLGAATISQISCPLVTCGEMLGPVFFDVRIHANKTPHDDCQHYYQIQGSTVRFTASVENLIADGEVTDATFSWVVPAGVVVNGKSDQAAIEVVLNSHGSVSLTCQVIVTTTGGTSTNFSTAHFAVITADEAAQLAGICHLSSLTLPLPAVLVAGAGPGFTAGGTHFVDPLWDPAPDELRNRVAVLGRAYSLPELYQVRAAAEQIVRAAIGLAKQTSVVIEYREVQADFGNSQARR